MAASAVFDQPPVDQWPAYTSWSQLDESVQLNAFLTSAVHLSKECVSLKTGGSKTSADQCLSQVAQLSAAVDEIKDLSECESCVVSRACELIYVSVYYKVVLVLLSYYIIMIMILWLTLKIISYYYNVL